MHQRPRPWSWPVIGVVARPAQRQDVPAAQLTYGRSLEAGETVGRRDQDARGGKHAAGAEAAPAAAARAVR
eukprot:11203030-Lingulodinium_polyedra.AAC.1